MIVYISLDYFSRATNFHPVLLFVKLVYDNGLLTVWIPVTYCCCRETFILDPGKVLPDAVSQVITEAMGKTIHYIKYMHHWQLNIFEPGSLGPRNWFSMYFKRPFLTPQTSNQRFAGVHSHIGSMTATQFILWKQLWSMANSRHYRSVPNSLIRRPML